MTLKLSIIVPFSDDGGFRAEVWGWTRRYWEAHLPDAEIIVGEDRKQGKRPFSKSAAVNDGASRATGDVFVIMDADACLSAKMVARCATRSRAIGTPVWFVPFDRMYRLRRKATEALLETDPRTFEVSEHPLRADYEGIVRGYYAGALCQVMCRDAWDAVGGFDPRFRGWGHEDYAHAAALDTMWGLRRWTLNPALHLWHEGSAEKMAERTWSGQSEPRANDAMLKRYKLARGDRGSMKRLVDEYASPRSDRGGPWRH